LLRADVLPREDHVERVARPDEPRQTLGAAHAGNDPELHLRETELRLRVIGADAIRARERDLETGAETRAMDGRDDRNATALDHVRHALAIAARRFGILLGSERQELLDVGARDEDVR